MFKYAQSVRLARTMWKNHFWRFEEKPGALKMLTSGDEAFAQQQTCRTEITDRITWAAKVFIEITLASLLATGTMTKLERSLAKWFRLDSIASSDLSIVSCSAFAQSRKGFPTKERRRWEMEQSNQSKVRVVTNSAGCDLLTQTTFAG